MERQKRILIILYGTGLLGYAWYPLHPVMHMLTPFVLFLSAGLALRETIQNHESEVSRSWNYKGIFLFIAVYVLSMLLEGIGVATGYPFGVYSYGPNMGVKIAGVPAVIGVNWIVLVYGWLLWGSRLFPNAFWVAALFSATMATLTDIFMEPVAVALNYWRWQSEFVPLQNYAAWFAASFLFAFLFRGMHRVSGELLRLYAILLLVYFVLFRFLVLPVLSMQHEVLTVADSMEVFRSFLNLINR